MLLIILVLIAFEELYSKIGGMATISVQDCVLLINRSGGSIIDIRDANAFASSHIANSINLPKNALDSKINALKLAKDKALILVDSHNVEAASIGKKLISQGYTKVYALCGGIVAWKDANLPLNKNKKQNLK
jgi:rhodanese-related sulfurtransferase